MDADIEVRPWADLAAEEERQLFGWGSDHFGVAAYGLRWATPKWRFLIWKEGHPVAHVAALRRTVSINEQLQPVGGLTRLLTVPDRRGRGLATLALQHAAHFVAAELGLAFGLGFCPDRLVPFYSQRGWRQIADPVFIDQPTGKLRAPLATVVLAVGDDEWPHGEVDVRGLPW